MEQYKKVIDNREVRIFISSTFTDLQEERDRLVQRLVSNLKRTFSSQNITIHATDLRWGIKDNEILQGNLMNICFREIDKCRPFFIGILANYYGTTRPLSELCDNPQLKSFYNSIKNDYPDDGLSATELEIQYAILQNIFKGKMTSYFLIKEDKKRRFSWFRGLFTRPSASDLKLRKLKNKIRNYKSNHQDEKIEIIDYNDFTSTLDNLEQQIELRIKDVFASIKWNLNDYIKSFQNIQISRLSSVTYPHNSDMDFMTKFVSDSECPVLAMSNYNYQANILIANWIKKCDTNNAWKTICSYSLPIRNEKNPIEIGRYLLRELDTIIGSNQDPWEKIPHEIAKYITSFNKIVVLIFPNIDKVKNLEHLILTMLNTLQLKDLVSNNLIKIIVTFDDKCLINRLFSDNRVIRREVMQFSSEEKKEIVYNYLEHYGKAGGLDNDQIKKIISLDSSILLTITILDYLLIFSNNKTISTDIDLLTSYISSPTSIYDNILDRIENIFLDDRINAIRDLLCFVSLSYNGIPESDVLDLCKGLTTFELTLLENALQINMIMVQGRLILDSEELKECIMHRYISSNEEESNIRERIILYYRYSDIYHAYDELLFQYKEVGDTDGIYKLIAKNKHSIKYFLKNRPADYVQAWNMLWTINKEKYKINKIVSLFNDISDKEDALTCYDIYFFFYLYCSNYDLAYEILESGIKYFERAGGNNILAYGVYKLSEAEMLHATGIKSNIEKSISIIKEVAQIYVNSQQFYPEFNTILDNHWIGGQLDIMHSEYIQDLKTLDSRQQKENENIGEAQRLYNQAEYLSRFTGEIDKALKMFINSLDIRKKHNDSNLKISDSLNMLGKCYYNMGEYEIALQYLEEGYQLIKKEKGDNHPSLINHCIILQLCATSLNDIERNNKYMSEYFMLLYELKKSNLMMDLLDKKTEDP